MPEQEAFLSNFEDFIEKLDEGIELSVILNVPPDSTIEFVTKNLKGHAHTVRARRTVPTNQNQVEIIRFRKQIKEVKKPTYKMKLKSIDATI